MSKPVCEIVSVESLGGNRYRVTVKKSDGENTVTNIVAVSEEFLAKLRGEYGHETKL